MMPDHSPASPGSVPTTGYREFTWAALLLGLVQGIILNLAFVYISLKLGFSISGSTIAAITGYVFLRGILRKGSVLENNLNQTIASGINSAGTGVVFVLPAMFLLTQPQGGPTSFVLWPLLIAGIGGAILGVVLIIPLRQQLIELDRLRFPSGVAVAEIIRSGTAGFDKAKLLVIGFVIAASWKALMLSNWLEMPGLLENEDLNLSFGLLPAYLAPVLSLSLLNFAAGLLTGRSGLVFFIGGVLAWWVISPSIVLLGWTPPALESTELASFIAKQVLYPLGIGVLVGAALAEVIRNGPAIRSALGLLNHAATGRLHRGLREEMPTWLLITGLGVALLFFWLALWFTPGVSFGSATLATLLGVLWMGLAGLIVAQATGLTDISPISGMALIAITTMLLLLDGNLAAAMLITIGVSVAIGQSADMMQDLKTGFLVGSRPFLQQLGQLLVSWIGVVVAFWVIYLLWFSGGGTQPGFGPGTSLPAPQAAALSQVALAVQQHTAPTDKFFLGSVVGVLLGFAPISGLGVLVGLAMYLPFAVTFGYGLGCLTQMWLLRRRGLAYVEHQLVPLAAGLIIGEALIGMGHAIYSIVRAT